MKILIVRRDPDAYGVLVQADPKGPLQDAADADIIITEDGRVLKDRFGDTEVDFA